MVDKDLPLFLVSGLESSLTLSPEEGKHALRVLRLSDGDEIYVTDGKGHLFLAELGSSLKGEETPFRIIEEVPLPYPSPPRLHIAIAPTKNSDRIEWLLEKLVELGLHSFSLVHTDRCLRKQCNIERYNRIAISALKQSYKTVLPSISEYPSLDLFLGEKELPDLRFVGYCGSELLRKELAHSFIPGREALYLIGPEGDFSPREIDLVLQKGFAPVAFGQERLRTETAGLYAGMLHHILNTQNNK